MFGALLVGTGMVLVWRDRRRSGPIEGRVLVLMMVEAVSYALAFGLVDGHRSPGSCSVGSASPRRCLWPRAPAG